MIKLADALRVTLDELCREAGDSPWLLFLQFTL